MKVVTGFPKFLVDHVRGLAVAILSDFDTLSLVVLGVLLGLLVSPLVGATGALGIYVVLRTFSNAAAAKAQEINFLARCVRDKDLGR